MQCTTLNAPQCTIVTLFPSTVLVSMTTTGGLFSQIICQKSTRLWGFGAEWERRDQPTFSYNAHRSGTGSTRPIQAMDLCLIWQSFTLRYCNVIRQKDDKHSAAIFSEWQDISIQRPLSTANTGSNMRFNEQYCSLNLMLILETQL